MIATAVARIRMKNAVLLVIHISSISESRTRIGPGLPLIYEPLYYRQPHQRLSLISLEARFNCLPLMEGARLSASSTVRQSSPLPSAFLLSSFKAGNRDERGHLGANFFRQSLG